MRRTAYSAATLIALLGLLALIVPGWFAALVAWMQPSPQLYVAAALRAGIGVALLLGAREARARSLVYFFGVLMVAGGLVIPFIGQGLARPILDAWNSGAEVVVRAWGVSAIALGSVLLWALTPRRAGENGQPTH